MEERRKHERWMLSSYFDIYDSNLDSAVGYLAEVSYGGFMMISDQPIQTNIVLPLKVDLIEEVDRSQELKVVTRSVRCTRDEDMDCYNTGLKLIDTSSGDLKIIRYMIETHAIYTTDDE
ncbi:MAG: hypothetical protein GY866_15965 [Proteobacteria bacterium]|nr:hypothetical protein [Pseudomonadota bacterium]